MDYSAVFGWTWMSSVWTSVGSALAWFFKGVFTFLGLWVIYWLSWFLGASALFMFMRGKAPTLSFWVCFWFGFFSAIIHVIARLIF